MSTIFDRVRNTIGAGRSGKDLYMRAFERGVLLKDYAKAVEFFQEAGKRLLEQGDTVLAARARANARLYRYLIKGDAQTLSAALQALEGVEEIESIGLQHEMMAAEPLRAELDCRVVEAAIAQSQDDAVRQRDLHKLAASKFQAIAQRKLLTYDYVKSRAGHNESTEVRAAYHQGLYHFYEAMVRKDSDPAAAANELALSSQAFRNCNDMAWLHQVDTLLKTWRISRTCWLCHREVQGYELHFTMCRATVTPYTRRLLEALHQDSAIVNLESMKIAVCTPCGSMITFKAAEEVAKVRREVHENLEEVHQRMEELERRLRRLERLTGTR